MLAILVRSIILYIIVIAAMRFTGKRQLAQLQPAEFVITILMSEVAALPMEDSEVPLLAALVPIVTLVAMEIIISAANLKNFRFRKLMTGSPVVVINDGKLEQKAMKSLRLSVSDLLDSLRLKGIFDINEVQYAIVETNGGLSVLEKAELRTAQAGQVTKNVKYEPIPFSVINDGILIEHNFKNAHTTKERVLKQLRKKNLKVKDVLLMTVDENGNFDIVERDKEL